MLGIGRASTSIRKLSSRSMSGVVNSIHPSFHSIHNAQLAPLDLKEDLEPIKETENSSNLPALNKPRSLAQGNILGISKSRVYRPTSILNTVHSKNILLSSQKNANMFTTPLIRSVLSPATQTKKIAQNKSGSRVVHILPRDRAPRPITPFPPETLEYEQNGVISIPDTRDYTRIPQYLINSNTSQLPHVSDVNFEQILRQKLLICSHVLNFDDPNTSAEEKDAKSRGLCEIVQLFEQTQQVRKLPEDLQEEVFKMIEINVLDQSLYFPDEKLSNGYMTVVVNEEWTHLFYCYQIMNRFAQTFPESDCLSIDTVKLVAHLISTPDNNERLQLLAFLRSYYDFHPGDRIGILKIVKAEIMRYIQHEIPPYCIPPLLVFSAHMFNRSGRTFTKEYTNYLRECIFQLFKSPHLYVFIQNYLQLLTTLFTVNKELAEEFLAYMLKIWKDESPMVKVAQITLLIETCAKVDPDRMINYSKTVFIILSRELVTTHQKTIMTVFSLWLGNKIEPWVEKDSRRAVCYMYDNVKRIADYHWSQMIREKGMLTLGEMGKLDRQTFLKMRNQKGSASIRRKRYSIEHEALKAWTQIALEVYEVVGDRSFDVKEKVYEIRSVFEFKQQEKNENFVFIKAK